MCSAGKHLEAGSWFSDFQLSEGCFLNQQDALELHIKESFSFISLIRCLTSKGPVLFFSFAVLLLYRGCW